MWLESPALLLLPLSVGVPITGASRLIFSGFLSCCSFRVILMMMRTTMTKTRLGSSDQTKGHAVTVRGGENGRCYCRFSVKTLIEAEKIESVLPSVTSSHSMSLKAFPMATIFWFGSWHLPGREDLCEICTRISSRLNRAELLPVAPGLALLVHLVIEGSVGTPSADTCETSLLFMCLPATF